MNADLETRYLAAAHAMQSGVAAEHALGSNDGSPKHLRVGVNMALVEGAALAGALIAKGVITQDEYDEALVVGLEAEVARYEDRLGAKHDVEIKLA